MHASMKRRSSLGGAALIATVVAGMLCPAWAQTEYEVLMSTTNAEVREFLGTDNAKLVYVNILARQKALHYVDFSEGDGEPVIHRIPGVNNHPAVPVVSPDGNWVVYASGPGVSFDDGEAGTSVSTSTHIYICRLAEDAEPVLLTSENACEPRFLWEAESLTVVYPTHAPNCAWEGVGKTMLVTVDTSGGVAVPGTPRVLFEHGSYTGGLSNNGRFLCGGGRHAAMLDLQSNRTRPDTVTDQYSGQACNVSITSSSTRQDVLMCLDFAPADSTHIPPNVNNGQRWDTWQLIWLMDSHGDWVRWYKYPTAPEFAYSYVDTNNDSSSKHGYETVRKVKWHHPEWSNHPYFAVATINVDRSYRYSDWDGWPMLNATIAKWENTGHQERIALVNLKSGEYHEVMRRKGPFYLRSLAHLDSLKQTNGLYWPTLWVDIPDTFVEDSEWLPVADRGVSPKYGGALHLDGRTVTSVSPLREVAIYDLRGRMVYSAALTSAQKRVDLPRRIGNSAGGYVVRVRTADGRAAAYSILSTSR